MKNMAGCARKQMKGRRSGVWERGGNERRWEEEWGKRQDRWK